MEGGGAAGEEGEGAEGEAGFKLSQLPVPGGAYIDFGPDRLLSFAPAQPLAWDGARLRQGSTESSGWAGGGRA